MFTQEVGLAHSSFQTSGFPFKDFPGWLDDLSSAFQHGNRVVPTRTSRFLRQLRTQAELTAGASRLLLKGLQRDTRIVCETAQRLALCGDEARNMHEQFKASLKHTYITPLDCGDLMALSLGMAGIVEALRDIAKAAVEVKEDASRVSPVQREIVFCTDTLEELIVQLDSSASGAELYSRFHAHCCTASGSLHENHIAMIRSCTDQIHILNAFALKEGFGVVLGHLRLTGQAFRPVG